MDFSELSGWKVVSLILMCLGILGLRRVRSFIDLGKEDKRKYYLASTFYKIDR